MELYLLKAFACMAIFLLFYLAVLEKQTMHVFKRFYLLAALCASFCIPAIVFVDYVVIDIPTKISVTSTPVIDLTAQSESSSLAKEASLDLPFIIWTLYTLGLVVFAYRFLRNLTQVIYKIKKNPKLKNTYTTTVLLLDNIVPYTFFRYIFLNKNNFEAKAIPQEVLWHEEAHALQKHSIDVLLLEVLQVVFWFNPLIYFFKKSIKLNHEFLADEAVLKKDTPTANYQKTLLSYLTVDTDKHHQSPLANAINYSSYSSIKKRFKIMKTQTSKKGIVLRSFILLPLLAMLIYGFSETEIRLRQNPALVNSSNQINLEKYNVEKVPEVPTLNITVKSQEKLTQEYLTQENLSININRKGHILFGDNLLTLSELKSAIKKSNSHLSKAERQQRVVAIIYIDSNTPKQTISDVENILNDHGIATIDIKTIRNTSVKNKQDGATEKQLAEYNKLAKHYNSMPRDKMKIYKKDVERLEYLFSKMSQTQQQNAEPFPDFPEPPPAPKAPQTPKAPKTLNEREEAARTIQKIIEEQDPYDVVGGGIQSRGNKQTGTDLIAVPSPAPTFFKMEKTIESQTEKMKGQIILMQNEEAKIKKQEVQLKREEASLKRQEMQMKKVETELEKQETLMTRQEEKMEEQHVMIKKTEAEIQEKEDLFAVQQNGEQFHIPTPPAPPKPVTPIDHIMAMAKKDAQFFFEGKKISSDTAIDLIKNNKNLHISSRSSKGTRPTVTISTSPIN